MSTWTHVAAIVRFDGLRLPGMPDPTPKLGQTATYDDEPAAWDACDVPCGSEGSLQYQLWTNPNPTSLAAYTAMIWGDLRDYEDVDEIEAYLGRITAGAMIRQGVAEISIEGRDPVVLLHDGGKWSICEAFRSRVEALEELVANIYNRRDSDVGR